MQESPPQPTKPPYILQYRSIPYLLSQSSSYDARSKTYLLENFVTKINSHTPRRIWNMLHKIQGNDISQPVKHLKVNNNSITDTKK